MNNQMAGSPSDAGGGGFRGPLSALRHNTEERKNSMEVNNDKFVAGGGTLALGIIGTALGGLNSLAGNGGGLFGGNRVADAEAKIAKLEAEKYTDAAVIAAQEREAISNAKLAAMTEKVEHLAIKNAADIQALKTESELRAEIDRKQAKIDLLEATAPINAALSANATAIAGIQQVLGSITKVVIPSSAVCGGTTAAATSTGA